MSIIWIGYLENEPVESSTVGFDTELDQGVCVVGCRECRYEIALLSKARPVQPYVYSLECPCGSAIVEFENDCVVRYDAERKRWAA